MNQIQQIQLTAVVSCVQVPVGGIVLNAKVIENKVLLFVLVKVDQKEYQQRCFCLVDDEPFPALFEYTYVASVSLTSGSVTHILERTGL